MKKGAGLPRIAAADGGLDRVLRLGRRRRHPGRPADLRRPRRPRSDRHRGGNGAEHARRARDRAVLGAFRHRPDRRRLRRSPPACRQDRDALRRRARPDRRARPRPAPRPERRARPRHGLDERGATAVSAPVSRPSGGICFPAAISSRRTVRRPRCSPACAFAPTATGGSPRASSPISARGPSSLKGGHGRGAESRDLLFDGRFFTEFSAPRLRTRATHGNGLRAVGGDRGAARARPEPRGRDPARHRLPARRPRREAATPAAAGAFPTGSRPATG